MTRVTIYKHIENIPASDTVSDVCALWRVYGRPDNGGFRVGLEYGSRLEYFDDQEATRRARWAIDVRKIDIPFSAISIKTLQDESRRQWRNIMQTGERAPQPVVRKPPDVPPMYQGFMAPGKVPFAGNIGHLYPKLNEPAPEARASVSDVVATAPKERIRPLTAHQRIRAKLLQG